MIGKWLRFGVGEPPADGEGLVFIEHYGDVLDLLEGNSRRVIFAVHRYGVLHDQNGGSFSIPTGAWWTSVPQPDMRD